MAFSTIWSSRWSRPTSPCSRCNSSRDSSPTHPNSRRCRIWFKFRAWTCSSSKWQVACPLLEEMEALEWTWAAYSSTIATTVIKCSPTWTTTIKTSSRARRCNVDPALTKCRKIRTACKSSSNNVWCQVAHKPLACRSRPLTLPSRTNSSTSSISRCSSRWNREGLALKHLANLEAVTRIKSSNTRTKSRWHRVGTHRRREICDKARYSR